MYNFGETNDIFSEQLVTMKKDAKYYLSFFGIWIATFIIIYFLILFSLTNSSLMGIVVILAFGVFYLAGKLSSKLYTEYEYIVVNGDLDIDIITGKSKRKRLLSIKLSTVDEMGDFNKNTSSAILNQKYDSIINCAVRDEETVYIITKHPKKGRILIITSFNEKVLNSAKKSVPRISQKF